MPIRHSRESGNLSAESEGSHICQNLWIPAFAGMTVCCHKITDIRYVTNTYPSSVATLNTTANG